MSHQAIKIPALTLGITGTILAAGAVGGALKFQVDSHEKAIQSLTSKLEEINSSCSRDRIKSIELSVDRLESASRYRLNTIE